MWPAGGRELQAPLPKGRRLWKGGRKGTGQGQTPGVPSSPRTKHRVASSPAEEASCLTHQTRLLGAPFLFCPPGEVVTSEMGFGESWEEHPILKIPPSCSHPKNTSATNFPQRVKFHLSHFSLRLFACRKHPGEVLTRKALPAGPLRLSIESWEAGGCPWGMGHGEPANHWDR